MEDGDFDERSIFLQAGSRTFGEYGQYPVGSAFVDRGDLATSGVHRPLQAGISGGEAVGADSIVVSGGYVDDEDHGTWIVYTGAGGNDPQTKKQYKDQVLEGVNLALAKSCTEGLPVRVIRGSKGDTRYSPSEGFRYDGLFRVDRFWEEIGRDGFLIWRYRLEALDLAAPGHDNDDVDEAPELPSRRTSTVQRIIRNSAISREVKRLHDYRCQFCGTRLETASGPYAEGAHVQGLGSPHHGPDSLTNVLCLCSNCHVLFDLGGIVVSRERRIIDRILKVEIGTLIETEAHRVRDEHFESHRNYWDSRPLVEDAHVSGSDQTL